MNLIVFHGMAIGFVKSILLKEGLGLEALIWGRGWRERSIENKAHGDVEEVSSPCGFCLL